MAYNATGVMTALPYIIGELKEKNISVFGVSEHWLLQHNAHILRQIDSDYNGHIVTCSNPSYYNGRFIGKGGVAILWHRALDNYVEIIPTTSDRIAAIRMCMQGISIVIIQVYLPSTNHHFDTFKAEVDNLSDLCALYSSENQLIVMGDLNARCTSNDITASLRNRDTYLHKMAREFNLTAVTETDHCTGAQYTFYPYTAGRPSRIDHILIDESLLSLMISCRIIPDAPLNVSRHLPVYLQIRSCTSVYDSVYSAPLSEYLTCGRILMTMMLTLRL